MNELAYPTRRCDQHQGSGDRREAIQKTFHQTTITTTFFSNLHCDSLVFLAETHKVVWIDDFDESTSVAIEMMSQAKHIPQNTIERFTLLGSTQQQDAHFATIATLITW